MANVIKPKSRRGAIGAPTTSDLADGEMAINVLDKKIFVRDGASIVEVANADSGGGGGTISPPAGTPTDYVYGMDVFGVPGWVKKDQFIGATLWPTSDHAPSVLEFTGEGRVQLRDADEYGMKFFDPNNLDAIWIPADGLYIVSFSVSMLVSSGTGIYRARVFTSLSSLVYDLTGRQSDYVSTGLAGTVDLTGTSGVLRLKAGNSVRLAVSGPVSPSDLTVRAPARATWISIQKVG